MSANHLIALRRFLEVASSRRGLLAGLAAGMLAADPDGIAARKKRGRKQKRRSRRNKRKNQNPKTVVDATCAGPLSTTFKEDNGTVRFAQTFTAIASGFLVKAEPDLVKDAGSEGDYILRLGPVDGAGRPTNDVLVETSIANADVPVGFPTVPFTFADPFPVKAGEAYALVLTRPGGQLQWDGSHNNPCSGQAFVSPNQSAPFTEVDVPDSDFILTTFIRS